MKLVNIKKIKKTEGYQIIAYRSVENINEKPSFEPTQEDENFINNIMSLNIEDFNLLNFELLNFEYLVSKKKIIIFYNFDKEINKNGNIETKQMRGQVKLGQDKDNNWVKQ